MAGLNRADLTPAEREIWQAEEDYWLLTKSRDIDGFMARAHPRVAVWPAIAALPMDRAKLHQSQLTRGDRDGLSAYDLAFHSIQVYGDAAVVYYTVGTTGTPQGGAPVQARSAITHTWIKDGGQWRLAGGMSRRLTG